MMPFRLHDVDAVGFDLDGTLLDHPASATEGVRALADALGVPFTPALVDVWFAAEERHFGAWSAGLLGWDDQRRARIAEVRSAVGAAPATAAQADAEFDVFRAGYRASWAAYDDVLDTLSRLRGDGVRIGVLTNGPGAQQRDKIERLGLSDLIDVVCAADEIEAPKPDARAFAALLAQLGTRADRTLFIGDDPALDVEGARRAGLRAARVRARSRGIAELSSAVRRAAANVIPTSATSDR